MPADVRRATGAVDTIANRIATLRFVQDIRSTPATRPGPGGESARLQESPTARRCCCGARDSSSTRFHARFRSVCRRGNDGVRRRGHYGWRTGPPCWFRGGAFSDAHPPTGKQAAKSAAAISAIASSRACRTSVGLQPAGNPPPPHSARLLIFSALIVEEENSASGCWRGDRPVRARGADEEETSGTSVLVRKVLRAHSEAGTTTLTAPRCFEPAHLAVSADRCA